jgi:hypothetical protein
MPSSTSSSKASLAPDPAAGPSASSLRRLSVVVVAGAAVVLALAELMAAAGFTRISRIESRTRSELTGASQLRRADGGSRKLLLAGNSLLLEGVNFPSLTRALEPDIEARRVIVEQTVYLDWYYGLKKLLAQGSRPHVIALSLSPAQLLSNGFRGDYSAGRLFRTQDLFGLAREASLSPTEAASLYISSFSSFYSSRSEIRAWLLGQLVPGMQQLRPHLARFTPQATGADEIRHVAPPRLEKLRLLAETHGADFVLLAPAVRGSGEQIAALVEAGRAARVRVLVPVVPNDIPASGFSDGFHLNAAGAERYTAALVTVLKELGSPRRDMAAGRPSYTGQ